MTTPPIDVPRVLASIQNLNFGRFYSSDVFNYYRAISGRYYESPSMFTMILATAVVGELSQFPFLSSDRLLSFMDEATIFWNEEVKKAWSPLVPNKELWQGWDAFTQLIQEDLKHRPRPSSPFPPQQAKMASMELTPNQLEKLTLGQKITYHSYRGDITWSEKIYEYASVYFPEVFPAMQAWWVDHQRIFSFYTNWAKEKFLQIPCENKDRIIAKVILLSNYRFNIIMADLLYPLAPTFQTTGFREGLLTLASHIRQEAEKIRTTQLSI